MKKIAKKDFFVKNRFWRQQNHGFTLIEMLVAVSIMSILVVVTIPFYSNFILRNTAGNVADELTAFCRKAQSYAMAGRGNSDWGINYAGGTVSLYQTSNNQVVDSFNVNSSIQISGLSQIVFSNRTGQTTPANISITGNDRTVMVNLNSLGVADEQ